MRFAILLACVLSLSATLSARDISTLDGKTYKNVTITGVTPAGLDISYLLPGGGLAIKEVLFTNLPDSVKKEFKYDKAKADAFLKKVKYYKEKRDQEMLAEYRKAYQEEKLADAREKRQEHLESMIVSGRVKVTLNALWSTHGGTIAWASTDDADNAQGQLGKIFVTGLSLPNGGSWAGFLYPTHQCQGPYPMYTTNLEQAVIILEENNTSN